MSASSTIDDGAEPELGEWLARGLDAKTLEQPPSTSLRPVVLPPPPMPPYDQPPLAILRTLGEGGMGIVRLALQRSLHREVAVKTVRHEGSVRARRALISEALVTGALQHPNIIPIYAIDEDEAGAPVIVMKRVEGVSWHALLVGDAPLPADAEDALELHLEILIQIAAAIEFAHRRGILHRDVKPENVMVGDLGEVYLLDWGLAVSTREADRGVLPLAADARGIAGTPAYMAPEMLRGSGEVLGPWTDVYLLGATLHEVLVGAPRHPGDGMMRVLADVATSDPYEYPREVPAELAAIANRACAREPGDRHASAEELRAALAGFRHHRSSIRLSEEASERLARLRALVTEPNGDPERPRRVRDLFGAARFGFEQALQAWPRNVAAEEGARDALTAIVRFELEQRNLSAASAYLDALDPPPPELVDAVGALHRELEREREEVGRLRRHSRESDRTLGAAGRAGAGIVFGLFAAGSLLVIQWGDESGRFPLTAEVYLGWLGWLTALTGAIVLAFRRVLFSNRVNREILVGTSATLVSIAVLRVVVVQSGIPVLIGFRLELILYAMALVVLALVTSRRVLVASAVFLSGAGVDAALDRGDLYPMTVTTFLAFVALSWAWASAAKRTSSVL